MWALRFMVTLIVRTAVIVVVAIAVSGVLALASAGAFLTDAKYLCIAIGCMLMGMAGVGRGSNLERSSDQRMAAFAWGKIPGFDAMRAAERDEPTLSPGAALFVSGAAVLAVGLAVL